MAINVTQKDAILHEIVDFCNENINRFNETINKNPHNEFISGGRYALLAVSNYCQSRLGYTGDMPDEVPNQSEKE